MKKIKNVLLFLVAVFIIVAKGVKHVNTKSVERIVNKSTQVTEKIVHETAANANWKLGGIQTVRSVTRSNAKHLRTFVLLHALYAMEQDI